MICKTVKSSPTLLSLNLLWTQTQSTLQYEVFYSWWFQIYWENSTLGLQAAMDGKIEVQYILLQNFLVSSGYVWITIWKFFLSHLSKQEHNWRVGISESIFEPKRKLFLSFILSLLFPPMYPVLASQKNYRTLNKIKF